MYGRKTLVGYLKNFIRYRFLLTQLVQRDFKVKYKRSILGIVWSLLNPLFNMLILTLVFSTLFKSNIPNFPVYFLAGSVMFSFFSEGTNLALSSIFANSSLIRKVYFPKYMFPLSKNIFSLINLLVSFIAVLFVMIGTGVQFHLTMLLFIIPVLYLFVFVVGMSLILSSAAVFFRDFAHLYGVILTALNFTTPIFYPIEILPKGFLPIVEWNPITQAIQMLRQILLHNHVPSWEDQLTLIIISVVTLFVGLFVFRKKQDQFILYI